MGFNWKRSGFVYIAILLGAVVLVTVLLSSPSKPTEVPLSEVIVMSQGNKIEEIIEEGEWLTITTTDGRELRPI